MKTHIPECRNKKKGKKMNHYYEKNKKIKLQKNIFFFHIFFLQFFFLLMVDFKVDELFLEDAYLAVLIFHNLPNPFMQGLHFQYMRGPHV